MTQFLSDTIFKCHNFLTQFLSDTIFKWHKIVSHKNSASFEKSVLFQKCEFWHGFHTIEPPPPLPHKVKFGHAPLWQYCPDYPTPSDTSSVALLNLKPSADRPNNSGQLLHKPRSRVSGTKQGRRPRVRSTTFLIRACVIIIALFTAFVYTRFAIISVTGSRTNVTPAS